jgi:hypothetical protein
MSAIERSPFVGFIFDDPLMILVTSLFLRSNPAVPDGIFRKLQIVAPALRPGAFYDIGKQTI